MVVFRKWVLRNELDAGGDPGGGGMDIAAAVDEIGAGLGFGETVNEEVKEPVNEPEVKPDPVTPPVAEVKPPVETPPVVKPPAETPPATPPGERPRFTSEAAPTTWTPAAAAQWAALPLSVREEIARRESNMFQGLEQYKADATVGKGIMRALAPVQEQLQRHGLSADAFVANLTQVHQTLANPQMSLEDRRAFAAQMLKNYGIEMTATIAPGETPPYVDPEVAALREKVAALESKHSDAERTAIETARQEQAAKIEAFANDKEAHPYFYDVADDIALLIRGSGGKMSLETAYEKAVFANPVTRAREAERIAADAAEKARKEVADRAAAATKANQGRGVRTSGHQGGGTTVQGSMDDTMTETLRAIQSRKK